MQMSRYYESLASQKERIKQQEEAREEERKRLMDPEGLQAELPEEPKMAPPKKDARQRSELHHISKNIWKSSRRFDADSSSNAKRSPFDLMVRENMLQKSLESDNLIVVEGMRLEENPEFIDVVEAINDWQQLQMNENISAGDFEGDFDEKFEIVESKTRPKLGFFEQSAYFDQLFPSLKI